MNKKMIILCVTLLVLAGGACKRDLVDDPNLFGPAGFYIVLRGTASPSVLYLENSPNWRPKTTLRVKVTNWDGSPLVGRPVYFEQWSSGKIDKMVLGYFDNPMQNVGTRYTNSNGEAEILFHGPSADQVSSNTTMYIRAILGEGRNEYRRDEGYLDSIQDWIPIQLIHHTY